VMQLNLTDNFLESWIYSACMCIANECDETIPLSTDDPHMMVMLDGAKAELLQMARQQVQASYSQRCLRCKTRRILARCFTDS
jgi:hypothetical protein